MEAQLQFVLNSLSGLTPALWLIVAGTLVLCGSLISRKGGGTNDPAEAQHLRGFWGTFAIIAVVVAAVLMWTRTNPTESVSGLMRFDDLSQATERLALLGGFVLILIGWNAVPRQSVPEYYGCLLLVICGAMLTGASNDLTTMFLGLELVSIPTYVLLGICKSDAPGAESMLKYFVLSAAASAFFLFGVSHLYGTSGTTDLSGIREFLGTTDNRLAQVGLLLALSGLIFRVTAVPFHVYASDVFAGTSLGMAATLSYLPKVVGFVALAKLAGAGPFPAAMTVWLVPVFTALAIITMTVGNAMALVQSQVKRLLAYSSVAHSGYLLLAFAAAMQSGSSTQVIWSYLAAYAAMTLGLFAGISVWERQTGEVKQLSDLSGLYQRHPWLGILMGICLLSLIGLPLTAGFWAKLRIFFAAIGADSTLLRVAAVIMAINAVIAVGYYWTLLLSIFVPSRRVESDKASTAPADIAVAPVFALLGCALLTIVWFFVPKWL